MTATGLAAVLPALGQPFEIKEYPVSEPGPGMIRVKISLANVCGSDIHTWAGDRDPAMRATAFPVISGHEMMGTVDALGEGISLDSDGAPLQVGDRVVYGYTFPCRRCPYCRTGRSTYCRSKRPHLLNSADQAPHFQGAFGQYYYLWPNHFVYKLPDAVPDSIGSGLNCALSQVIYGLEAARLTLDDSIVVQGCGGLGLSAIAVARERGAGKIIAIDGVDGRLELADKVGADELIDLREFTSSGDRVKRVWDLTDGWGANIACDFVGFPAVMLEGLEMLGNGGTYMEIGNINTGLTCEFEPNIMVRKHLRMIGMLQYEPRHLKQAVDFAARTINKYPYDKLMAYQYPLTEINRAFQEQSTGKIPRASLVAWA
jgi:D-arabinose 1-dehydrogenase-like Zn-dependent alcohol dehydrogenase